MTHYLATFSSGYTREIKNSLRAYTHAWLVSGWDAGFAASEELAHRAMNARRRACEAHRPGEQPRCEVVPVQIVEG